MKSTTTQTTVQLNDYGQQDARLQETNVNENGQKRNFTTIDMWNHNRKVRSASSRLRRWQLN
jgi:hypothetical protein